MARGKSILHLGCIGPSNLEFKERALISLHNALSKVADVTGVEVRADLVEIYKSRGICNNIVVGDIEHLDDVDLPARFDLVVIPDVIEHLSNPGLMLDGLKRFDAPILITTPSAFGLLNMLRFVVARFHEDPNHVMTFNPANLINLLRRHGYETIEFKTCHQQAARRQRLFNFGRVLFQMFPKLGGTLLMVAVKNSN